MNVRSPKKTTTNSQNINQENIPDFLKRPPPAVGLIQKEHVGNIQTNPLIPKQITNQKASPIPQKKYSDNDDNLLMLFPQDLFGSSISEENTASQFNMDKEPFGRPTQITDQEVQDNAISIIDSEKNNLGPYANIRIIPIKAHNKIKLKEAIERHPLTPMIEEWIKQKSDVHDTQTGYRNKMIKFIVFLIDLNVQYPTTFHLLVYKNALLSEEFRKHPRGYFSIVRTFFKWAKSKGYYEDISKWTYITPFK